MKPVDILIRNGPVLTMDAKDTVIESGAVAVKADQIVEVGKQSDLDDSYQAARTIDAQNNIIMPGLVNTHTHAAMSLFRGLADDLPLMSWLNDYIFKAEARWLNPESVKTATMLSCAEMLLSGTTTFCDGYFFEDVVATAVQATGMRAILAQGIVDFPAPGVPDPKENVAEAARFIESWRSRDPLITPSLFCHSPYTCSEETLKAARRLADKTDSLFQIHVAETRDEVAEIEKKHGSSPIQYLERIGILNPNTLLVHAIWVTETDISCMARHGVGVSVTTESEMKLASGIAPILDFLNRGIRVGIGTDSPASNNNLDMFQEMDITAKLHKANRLDSTAINAAQALALATRSAADAIGLEKQIGSLEAGKKADIIIIDTHKPHLTPLYDPASHLVYAAGGSDVSDVIIDGKLVVRDRKILTFDVESVMEGIIRLADEIRA